MERVNLDLQVQNSIVPAAVSLARFRISGKLPSLHVNFSDMKYKSLMRLIEVCIPRFDEEASGTFSAQTRPPAEGFQLSSGLFSQPEMEYNVDDDDNGDHDTGSMSREELFFEAKDGSSEVRTSTRCLDGL